jgi:hypothetical protein
MCYINENEKGSYDYGYYSTVGIAKCTKPAEIIIEGLKKNVNNTNIYTYIGVYNQ